MAIKKFENNEINTQEVRINKFLTDASYCSRRKADELIASGKVTIDGKVAELGAKVKEGSEVRVNGEIIKKENNLVLIAFNKPLGITCTTDQRDPDNIIDYIKYPKRIYPIGRLDKNSEGLILLTNDGDIVNKILRASNNHEKEYEVIVNKPVTDEFIKKMSQGVYLPELKTVTKPCKITKTGMNSFNIILTQGLNRQIRRMVDAQDYRVLSLRRIRIMHIRLGRLHVGGYRNLDLGELRQLEEELSRSTGKPAKDC
ncbi:MAG: pseudouridine synthase [Lachnospiraceae bacterium]|nr:pseudouridine synthase [Lachnospiraceae bacterium]